MIQVVFFFIKYAESNLLHKLKTHTKRGKLGEKINRRNNVPRSYNDASPQTASGKYRKLITQARSRDTVKASKR